MPAYLMLILTRKPLQRIMIGDDLILKLEGIKKGKVYLCATTHEGTEHFQGVANDTFHIAPDVSVMVLDNVRSNQVRLGFTADQSIQIVREEILLELAQSGRSQMRQ